VRFEEGPQHISTDAVGIVVIQEKNVTRGAVTLSLESHNAGITGRRWSQPARYCMSISRMSLHTVPWSICGQRECVAMERVEDG
jgi:hypothetical protein